MKLNNCQMCGIQLNPDDFDEICCECEDKLFCEICEAELTSNDKEISCSICINCAIIEAEDEWYAYNQ